MNDLIKYHDKSFLLWLALSFCVVGLYACNYGSGIIPAPPSATTANERLAVSYASITGLAKQAKASYENGLITKESAIKIADQLRNSYEMLDAADDAFVAGDEQEGQLLLDRIAIVSRNLSALLAGDDGSLSEPLF